MAMRNVVHPDKVVNNNLLIIFIQVKLTVNLFNCYTLYSVKLTVKTWVGGGGGGGGMT